MAESVRRLTHGQRLLARAAVITVAVSTTCSANERTPVDSSVSTHPTATLVSLLVISLVSGTAIVFTVRWMNRRTMRFMTEFAAAMGFPEDPMTSDTVHASGALRYLIPVPAVLVVWFVLQWAVVAALDAVIPDAAGWVGGPLAAATGVASFLVVFFLAVRHHVVFWSPDRVVLVASRLNGRNLRVVADAFSSQCRAQILPSLFGVRYLLETPDGAWRLKQPSKTRPQVERLVATLGASHETRGEED